MQPNRRNPKFWIGNGLLAIALVMLLYMGPLSEHLGMWAMGLWMAVAALGFYFATADKGPSSTLPD